jgi:hypothetical protein
VHSNTVTLKHCIDAEMWNISLVQKEKKSIKIPVCQVILRNIFSAISESFCKIKMVEGNQNNWGRGIPVRGIQFFQV